MGEGIVDERLGLPTIGFTKIQDKGQPEIQALNTPALPDFLVSSEGYINTHTLMRAQAYARISRQLEHAPLSPLGVALLARGAAYYVKQQAKEEINDMREEFKRDRPVSEDDINIHPLFRHREDIKWKPMIAPDDEKIKPKMISPEQTKSEGVKISDPVDVRETEVVPPSNLPPKPAQGTGKYNPQK
ncbi:MAG: hypothetical protein ACK502_08705 [Alphaproteobacteria bacterium]